MNSETIISKYMAKVVDTISLLDFKGIDELASLIIQAYDQEKTIFFFGNGGSAATASHLCGDYVKGLSYNREKRFKAMCLCDNLSALMAIANDISYDDIFIEQLKNFVQPDDIVIGISGSGNSMNVVKGLQYAKDQNAKTVAFCGYDGGKIKEIADIVIHAPIQDMEISEDVHMVIGHCLKRAISIRLV